MAARTTPVYSVHQAIEAFKLSKRIEGRMKRTLKDYDRVLGHFSRHIGDQTAEQLTQVSIREYIRCLVDHQWKAATINIHIRVLRCWLGWLYQEGLIWKDLSGGLRLLKTPNQYPYVLTEQQARSLLEAVGRQTWIGKRNWAMMLTFLDAMLRVSELLNLDLADVNLHTRALRIRQGKGEKERIVYMGLRLTRALRDWMIIRGQFPGEDRLFVSRGGFSLDLRNVQRIIGRLARKAKIEGVRCSPHTLRHTGATLYIRNGGDPFSLQRLLGHADIQTTMIYVHMAGTALKEAHAKASPVDRLLGG